MKLWAPAGALLACLALLTPPAQAARGVRGDFAKPFTYDGHTPNYLGGRIPFKGWAFNARTQPAQEVYLTIHAQTFAPSVNSSVAWRNYVTGVHTADLPRPDVQQRHNLPTAAVGFRFTFHLGHKWNFTNQGGKACLYARDHGSDQPWRLIRCRAIGVGYQK